MRNPQFYEKYLFKHSFRHIIFQNFGKNVYWTFKKTEKTQHKRIDAYFLLSIDFIDQFLNIPNIYDILRNKCMFYYMYFYSKLPHIIKFFFGFLCVKVGHKLIYFPILQAFQ